MSRSRIASKRFVIHVAFSALSLWNFVASINSNLNNQSIKSYQAQKQIAVAVHLDTQPEEEEKNSRIVEELKINFSEQ